jgi:hypothetical protein
LHLWEFLKIMKRMQQLTQLCPSQELHLNFGKIVHFVHPCSFTSLVWHDMIRRKFLILAWALAGKEKSEYAWNVLAFAGPFENLVSDSLDLECWQEAQSGYKVGVANDREEHHGYYSTKDMLVLWKDTREDYMLLSRNGQTSLIRSKLQAHM